MSTARRSPDEVRRLLELREAEKLTYAQLSERSGVPVHVLSYRASQDRRAALRTDREAAGAFVEVIEVSGATDTESVRGGFSGIELLTPVGLLIRLERHFDETTLGQVLALARC